MRYRHWQRVIPCGRLKFGTTAIIVILIGLVSPSSAHAQPSTIKVPGLVRDFPRAHPDFDIVPATGYGHYAGNVAESLGPSNKPELQPGGFKVGQQWRNAANLPIAPNMALNPTPMVLANAPLIAVGATVDSYDLDTGIYGPAPPIVLDSDLPTITPPTGLGPSVGKFVIKKTPQTISTSFLCDSFSTMMDAVILIQGDVTIHCLGDFTMLLNSRIELKPGATLRIYVGETFSTFQGAMLNMNTLDPNRCWIFNYSSGKKMNLSQYSQICANILSPDSELSVGQDVVVYGAYIGLGLEVKQTSAVHLMEMKFYDACSVAIKDVIGTAITPATGGITNANTFSHWFTDILGGNLSMVHTIDMVRNGAGVYEARINEFHPIDDRLLGNEGAPHNYFFTYELQANFVYNSCQQQFFQFDGSDDAWLFIDGELVLDIGGVIPATDQVIELDRLNLTDGQAYQMRFFYAQRQGFNAKFNFQTNLELIPPFITSTGTAGYD